EPEGRYSAMALGYDGKLFILAFDHRGSFQKKMFGIEGEPDEEQTQTISDAKHLIFEGMLAAAEKGLDEEASGVLVDEQSDCEMLAQQSRKGEGREGVVCVVLGRGASDDKVDEWLRAGAPVEGYVGFAIGRSIWWDALKGFLEEGLERGAAASRIAEKYL